MVQRVRRVRQDLDGKGSKVLDLVARNEILKVGRERERGNDGFRLGFGSVFFVFGW